MPVPGPTRWRAEGWGGQGWGEGRAEGQRQLMEEWRWGCRKDGRVPLLAHSPDICGGSDLGILVRGAGVYWGG